MLNNLSEQVRECLRHAEECAHRAKIEPDLNTQRDFLDLERRWLGLARSYQFAEQLESFSTHNKQRREEADDALKRLAERASRVTQ